MKLSSSSLRFCSRGLTLRMMMLAAPSSWICRTASKRAASPTANMRMTEATPRTMPSMVRIDRRPCRKTLCRLRRNKWEWRWRGILSSFPSSAGERTSGGANSLLGLRRSLRLDLFRFGVLALGRAAGAGVEADRLAVLQARRDLDELLVALANAHFALLDAAALGDVDKVLSLNFRHGLHRDEEDVGKMVDL